MDQKRISFFLFLLFFSFVNAQVYPDQQHLISGGDQLYLKIESKENIYLNREKDQIELVNGAKEGFFILQPATFPEAFNRGLPSWNGSAQKDQRSSFKVQMRYKMSYGWSRWVTVGYWDQNIWPSYGDTTFQGGKISVDYLKLEEYIREYQFKVIFTRENISDISPSLHQLSFFVSDSQTTDQVNINEIVADKPPEIFIPTNFVYQMDVDDEIGGEICSPSTVSMIIQSYDKEVDTYQFALRTKDPYWNLFGVWPRVVQHAAEYGLKGTVTRYRTWSQAYEVLKNRGRIAMSIGPPLYSGHLVMLAGFDSSGNPIVHDPAKRSGYSKVYDKRDLSESWFNKGGISYTFYNNSGELSVEEELFASGSLKLYPNPFHDSFKLAFEIKHNTGLQLRIYNVQGKCVYTSEIRNLNSGDRNIIVVSSLSALPEGIYFLQILTDSGIIGKKILKLR